MRIIRTFLIAAAVAMLVTPASAQSSYESFRNRWLQDDRNKESVSDLLNQQRLDLRRREEQSRRENEIRDLENENRRLRALRAQELDRQRRRDPASGIWSPARRR